MFNLASHLKNFLFFFSEIDKLLEIGICSFNLFSLDISSIAVSGKT